MARLAPAGVFYRHRPAKHRTQSRQHRRLGAPLRGAVDHMVVLDADSLMEGETLARAGRGAWSASPTSA